MLLDNPTAPRQCAAAPRGLAVMCVPGLAYGMIDEGYKVCMGQLSRVLRRVELGQLWP